MKKHIYVFAGVIIAVLFAACVPFEGSIDEVRKKAEGGGTRYTVSFESDGGTRVASQRIKEGEKAKKPVNPVRGTDLFVNWFIDEQREDIYTFSDPVTADITLYAKWIAAGTPLCYVSFDSKGGSFVDTQPVYKGEKAYKPDDPVLRGYAFDGWYTNDPSPTAYNFSALVTADMTLNATWTKVTDVPGANLAEKFAWLTNNALSGTEYTVQANASEPPLGPHSLSYTGYTPVTITLKGNSDFSLSYYSVTLSGNGSLFTVGSGVTLVLENRITLKGHNSNNAALIRVNSGGEFTMNAGTISGNTSSGNGGGVYVAGVFTMNNGTISGNTSSFNGGGVYVDSYSFAGTNVAGVFTMTGGTISGNTASSYGGGVYVSYYSPPFHGTFTKTAGGFIYGKDQGINEGSNSNLVKNGSGVVDNRGHVAYVYGYTDIIPEKIRDTSAGVGDILDSNLVSAAGGWEN